MYRATTRTAVERPTTGACVLMHTAGGRVALRPRGWASCQGRLRPTKVRCTSEQRFVMPSAPDFMPLGPWEKADGGIVHPAGFKAAGVYAGMRTGTRADVALVLAEKAATWAGVFTTNRMRAAPVLYCQELLDRNTARAVLINAGQANAATGPEGLANARESAAAASGSLSAAYPDVAVAPEDVLLMSTGVIGQQIPVDKLVQAVEGPLVTALGGAAEDGRRAAVAITTTDLAVKQAALTVAVGGQEVRVGGMAKGSGMIHPNMATMLALLTCDADVEPATWREIVKRASDNSFNQITVDGDTSTNDTVLGLTSSAAGGERISGIDTQPAQQLLAAVTALL